MHDGMSGWRAGCVANISIGRLAARRKRRGSFSPMANPFETDFTRLRSLPVLRADAHREWIMTGC